MHLFEVSFFVKNTSGILHLVFPKLKFHFSSQAVVKPAEMFLSQIDDNKLPAWPYQRNKISSKIY